MKELSPERALALDLKHHASIGDDTIDDFELVEVWVCGKCANLEDYYGYVNDDGKRVLLLDADDKTHTPLINTTTRLRLQGKLMTCYQIVPVRGEYDVIEEYTYHMLDRMDNVHIFSETELQDELEGEG